MNKLVRKIHTIIDSIRGKRYPFGMPPFHEKDNVPQLLEWTEEPYGLINGSNISVWFYTDEKGQIIEVMEAGHSNSYVCGKATSLFIEAILQLKSYNLELFTAGSLWIKTENTNNEDQKILRQLRNDLSVLEQKTGLVKVVNERHAKLSHFRINTIEACKKFNGSKMIATISNISDNKMNIGLLDYLQFKTNNFNKPIQFKINHSIYRTAIYEKLLKLHANSLHSFRIQDIKRRAEVYGKWIVNDIFELLGLIRDRENMSDEVWNTSIIPYSGTRDYYTATTSMEQKKKDIDFQEIEEYYQSWRNDFDNAKIKGVVIEDFAIQDKFRKLLTSVEKWTRNTKNIKDLDYGTTSYKDRFERTAPYFIFHDFDWIIQMIEILILDYEDERDAIPKIWEIFQDVISRLPDPVISIDLRDIYNPRTTKSLSDLWHNLQYALEEIVKKYSQTLPIYLQENIPVIFEKLNKKRDASKRQQRVAFHKKINQTVLFEALVRGWPSFFLRTTELRDLYKLWNEEVREKIWHEIYMQLRKAGINMMPFLEPNVSFNVSIKKNDIILTPYFGINSEMNCIFFHKKIGTIHPVLPWVYKNTVTTTDKDIDNMQEEFRKAVNSNNFDGATSIIRDLLKINPILSCSKFFNEFWKCFGEIKDENLKTIHEFQLALEEIGSIETFDTGYARLKKFYKLFPYDLADTPVRLAYYGEKYKDKLILIDDLNKATNEQKEYFQEIGQMIQDNECFKHIAGFIKLSEIFLAELNDSIIDKYRHHLFHTKDMNCMEILEYVKEVSFVRNYAALTQSDIQKLVINEILKDQFQIALKMDQDSRNLKISRIIDSLNSIDEEIWNEFQTSKYLDDAKKIDNEFVLNILNDKILKFSYKFNNEYEPYFYLNTADRKMQIVVELNNWYIEQNDFKINENKLIAESFNTVIRNIESIKPGIEGDDKKKLDVLRNSKIEPLIEDPFKEDSYTRFDLLSEANNLISHFASQSSERFKISYLNLPLYTPAYIKFIELKFLAEPEYVDILKGLVKHKIPVGAVISDYKINLDTNLKGAFIPSKIEIANNELTVYNHENKKLVIIEFKNAQDETLRHLKREIESIAFRTTSLHPQGSSLAYRVLRASINTPPRTRLLQRIISENLAVFVYILAYTPARLSPNITKNAFGKNVSSELLLMFRDIALVTKKQQIELESMKKEIEESYPIESISMDIKDIILKINIKEGYNFKN
ncbi:MAG: hypothetical protein KKA81_08605 [Bacteroidetes bacterium]|nr:hypothetical protein [Bacteroidota bacterium]